MQNFEYQKKTEAIFGWMTLIIWKSGNWNFLNTSPRLESEKKKTFIPNIGLVFGVIRETSCPVSLCYLANLACRLLLDWCQFLLKSRV